MVQLKTEMRTQKMELEARAQAAEDGRRQVTEQLSELTMKQQRALAKQVASTYLYLDVSSRVVLKRTWASIDWGSKNTGNNLLSRPRGGWASNALDHLLIQLFALLGAL